MIALSGVFSMTRKKTVVFSMYDPCFLPIGCNSQSMKLSFSLSEHAIEEGIHN